MFSTKTAFLMLLVSFLASAQEEPFTITPIVAASSNLTTVAPFETFASCDGGCSVDPLCKEYFIHNNLNSSILIEARGLGGSPVGFTTTIDGNLIYASNLSAGDVKRMAVCLEMQDRIAEVREKSIVMQLADGSFEIPIKIIVNPPYPEQPSPFTPQNLLLGGLIVLALLLIIVFLGILFR